MPDNKNGKTSLINLTKNAPVLSISTASHLSPTDRLSRDIIDSLKKETDQLAGQIVGNDFEMPIKNTYMLLELVGQQLDASFEELSKDVLKVWMNQFPHQTTITLIEGIKNELAKVDKKLNKSFVFSEDSTLEQELKSLADANKDYTEKKQDNQKLLEPYIAAQEKLEQKITHVESKITEINDAITALRLQVRISTPRPSSASSASAPQKIISEKESLLNEKEEELKLYETKKDKYLAQLENITGDHIDQLKKNILAYDKFITRHLKNTRLLNNKALLETKLESLTTEICATPLELDNTILSQKEKIVKIQQNFLKHINDPLVILKSIQHQQFKNKDQSEAIQKLVQLMEPLQKFIDYKNELIVSELQLEQAEFKIKRCNHKADICAPCIESKRKEIKYTQEIESNKQNLLIAATSIIKTVDDNAFTKAFKDNYRLETLRECSEISFSNPIVKVSNKVKRFVNSKKTGVKKPKIIEIPEVKLTAKDQQLADQAAMNKTHAFTVDLLRKGNTYKIDFVLGLPTIDNFDEGEKKQQRQDNLNEKFNKILTSLRKDYSKNDEKSTEYTQAILLLILKSYFIVKNNNKGLLDSYLNVLDTLPNAINGKDIGLVNKTLGEFYIPQTPTTLAAFEQNYKNEPLHRMFFSPDVGQKAFAAPTIYFRNMLKICDERIYDFGMDGLKSPLYFYFTFQPHDAKEPIKFIGKMQGLNITTYGPAERPNDYTKAFNATLGIGAPMIYSKKDGAFIQNPPFETVGELTKLSELFNTSLIELFPSKYKKRFADNFSDQFTEHERLKLRQKLKPVTDNIHVASVAVLEAPKRPLAEAVNSTSSSSSSSSSASLFKAPLEKTTATQTQKQPETHLFTKPNQRESIVLELATKPEMSLFESSSSSSSSSQSSRNNFVEIPAEYSDADIITQDLTDHDSDDNFEFEFELEFDNLKAESDILLQPDVLPTKKVSPQANKNEAPDNKFENIPLLEKQEKKPGFFSRIIAAVINWFKPKTKNIEVELEEKPKRRLFRKPPLFRKRQHGLSTAEMSANIDNSRTPLTDKTKSGSSKTKSDSIFRRTSLAMPAVSEQPQGLEDSVARTLIQNIHDNKKSAPTNITLQLDSKENLTREMAHEALISDSVQKNLPNTWLMANIQKWSEVKTQDTNRVIAKHRGGDPTVIDATIQKGNKIIGEFTVCTTTYSVKAEDNNCNSEVYKEMLNVLTDKPETNVLTNKSQTLDTITASQLIYVQGTVKKNGEDIQQEMSAERLATIFAAVLDKNCVPCLKEDSKHTLDDVVKYLSEEQQETLSYQINNLSSEEKVLYEKSWQRMSPLPENESDTDNDDTTLLQGLETIPQFEQHNSALH